MTGRDAARVFVGVLQLSVLVRGARSLKDRRQVIVSLRDRLRHKFDVTFHEIGDGEEPTHRVVVLTTAGNDARLVRSVLDQCAHLVQEHPVATAVQVDVDVFRWHPPEGDWAARMMAEYGSSDPGDDDDE
ncbi:MAG: DUF503 domain-containing protein [Myxococcota bacterium]